MAQHNEGELSSLVNDWTNYSAQMGNRLMENVQRQQQEYERVYGKWMDISRKVGTEVTRVVSQDAAGDELYSVWKNYNNLISNRLDRLMSGNRVLGESIQKTLSEYSARLGRQMMGAGPDGGPREDGLYWTWVDFSARMGRNVSELASGNRVEKGELAGLWGDFSERFHSLLEESLAGGVENAGDLRRIWTENAREMRESLQGLVEGSEKELDAIHQAWSEQTRSMGKRISGAMVEVGADYEELLHNYLERSADFNRNFGMFAVRGLSGELEELRERVARLEAGVQAAAGKSVQGAAGKK
jgi:hypothetical protein